MRLSTKIWLMAAGAVVLLGTLGVAAVVLRKVVTSALDRVAGVASVRAGASDSKPKVKGLRSDASLAAKEAEAARRFWRVMDGPRSDASADSGTVSNAGRVVAGMRAGFRACYHRALVQNPDAQGSIRLTIRVGPGGEVQSVSALPGGNLPAAVVDCVRARASVGRFAPSGHVVVRVPLTFVHQ